MHYLGYLILAIGAFFVFCGFLGLIRFKGFYSKLHGASVMEGYGIPICLFGLALCQQELASAVKLILAIILILILNPITTYALAKASVHCKLDENGNMK